MAPHSWPLIHVPHSWPIIRVASFVASHSWRFMYGTSLMFLPLCANLNRDTLTSPLIHALDCCPKLIPQTHPPSSFPDSFPASPHARRWVHPQLVAAQQRSRAVKLHSEKRHTPKCGTFSTQKFRRQIFSRCARDTRELVADRASALSAAEFACSFAR